MRLQPSVEGKASKQTIAVLCNEDSGRRQQGQKSLGDQRKDTRVKSERMSRDWAK